MIGPNFTPPPLQPGQVLEQLKSGELEVLKELYDGRPDLSSEYSWVQWDILKSKLHQIYCILLKD